MIDGFSGRGLTAVGPNQALLGRLNFIVDIYRARWTIEDYFNALKNQCGAEERQLESGAAYEKALAILVVLAWRVLRLRTVSRDTPDEPAHAVLSPQQIKVARFLIKKRTGKDVAIKTCEDAINAIARLGGHITNNGPPGWKVLWRGFERLLVTEEGYELLRDEM